MNILEIKDSLKIALSDRGYLTAWIVGVLVFFAILVLCLVEIRPSDLQVPIRYSAFGITNIYRAQWYHELGFALFAIVVMGLHTLLSLKLYALKNREFAIAFQWLTAVMLTIAFLFFIAIFRVISIVE